MGELISGSDGVAAMEASVDLDATLPSPEITDIPVPIVAELEDVLLIPSQPAAEKAEPKSDKSYEQILAEVSEHFGGRVFTYKTHSGTATQMIEQCPMAKMSARRGTEFVISFLEKFDGQGVPDQKPEEDKPKGEDALQADDPMQKGESDSLDGGSDKKNQNVVESKTETDNAATKVMIAQIAIVEAKRESSESSETKSDAVNGAIANDSSSSDVAARKEERNIVTIDASTKLEEPEAIIAKVKIKNDEPVKIEATPLPFANEEKKTTVEKIETVGKKQPIEVLEIIEQPASEVESIVFIDPIPEDSFIVPAVMIEQEADRQDEMAVMLAELPPIVAETSQDERPESTLVLKEIIDPILTIEKEPVLIENEQSLLVVEDEMNISVLASEIPTLRDREVDDVQEQVVEIADSPDLPIMVMSDREIPEITDPNPLADIILEKIEAQPEEARPAIKEHLVEVVRSIEILKRSQTAEECADALEDLKKNLTAFFEKQGYGNPERMAIELLQDYHLMMIDEAMNEALQAIKSKQSHHFALPKVGSTTIGRHVVSMLIVTVSNGLLLRQIYAASSKA